MINKKIFLALCMIFIFMATAQALTIKQNTESQVKIVCLNNGYCSSSAVCNVSIFDPDNVVLVNSISATRDPTGAFYNVTLNSSQTSKNGDYCVTGFCKDGSVNKEIDFCFDVTPNGRTLTTSNSIIYFISLLAVFIVFCLSFYFALMIPWENTRDGEGKIISVNKFKYLKLVLIPFTYAMFTWILNLVMALSQFLSLTIYTGYFSFMFELFINMTVPFFFVWIIIAFAVILRDSKIIKNISHGFRPK